ncbi:hypothetical protein HK097_006007, partial [Rhizophlyctis rosea]
MDQDSSEDVCAQVNLMGDYYRNASQCVVVFESLGEDQIDVLDGLLLGPKKKAGGSGKAEDGGTTGSAMERELVSRTGMWDDLSQEERDALIALSRDPWFKRLWTYQEAVLPQQLIFVIACQTASGKPKGIVLRNFDEMFEPIIGKACNTSDGVRLYKHRPPAGVERLLDPSAGFEIANRAFGGVSAASVLDTSFGRNCYMPEDKIFGVLGLVPFSIPVKYAGTQAGKQQEGEAADSTTVTSIMTAFLDFFMGSFKVGDVSPLLFMGLSAYNLRHENRNPLKAGWCPLYDAASWSGIPLTPLLIPPTISTTNATQLSFHGRIVAKIHRSTNPFKLGKTPTEIHIFFHKMAQYFHHFGASPHDIAKICMPSSRSGFDVLVKFFDRALRMDTTPPSTEELYTFGQTTSNHPALEDGHPVSFVQCDPLPSPTSLSDSKPFWGIVAMNDEARGLDWRVFDLGSVCSITG